MKRDKIYLEGSEKIIDMVLETAKEYLGNGINCIDVSPELKPENCECE